MVSKLQGLILRRSDEERLKRQMRKWLKGRTVVDDKRALELQLSNVKRRLDQLTDALLNQLIDKVTFGERKQRLLEERDSLEMALLKRFGFNLRHIRQPLRSSSIRRVRTYCRSHRELRRGL